MRGLIYSKEDKEKVKQALLSGKSYNEITNFLGVPKSTISTWFGKTLKRPETHEEMLNRLKEIRKLSSIKIKSKWEKIRQDENSLITKTVQEELPTYPLDNIGFYKSMLSMLYWAEGSKYKNFCGLKFVNTDPKLIKLYMALLRKCYNINENKFSIGLQVHYYHSINKVKKFWSDTLNIPQSRFNKVYIKKRSKTKKFRKNFAGICSIYYGESKIRKELLELGSHLQMYIAK